MAPILELRRRLDELPGWLSYEEGETLYRLAERCTGRGAIVEIGSWRGKSTTCLGLGSKAGNSTRVFAVDRHTDGTFPEWERNVEAAGIADVVTPIKGLSQELASGFDEPIELLFRSRSFKDGRFVFPTMALARKVPANAPADRVRNRYAMGVKNSMRLVR